jgi:hypothetical protein
MKQRKMENLVVVYAGNSASDCQAAKEKVLSKIATLDQQSEGFHLVENLLLRPLESVSYLFSFLDADGEEFIEGLFPGDMEIQRSLGEDLFAYGLQVDNYSIVDNENFDNKRRIIERDEGTYPHITINQLKKYGVCDEKKWDDVNKVNYIPPLETYFNARNYAKTINFYSVYDVIPGIEKALSDSSDSKKVVVVGCRVDQGFTENNGEIIKVNNNSVIGGHMMVINGYNRSNATVDLHNSWSTNWGNNGKGKVEYEWLIKNTTDCYVIEIS